MAKPIGIAAIKIERDRWIAAHERAKRGLVPLGDGPSEHEAFMIANRLTWALSMLGAETADEAAAAERSARERALEIERPR